MFRLLELSLHGWDVWPPVRIPLGRDVVLLTGPNGSGKTTLLDAIRQLLNAPRLSSRRRLQNYLRRPDAPALIRAVVSNDGAGTGGAGAPFRRERITTPEATLACALVPAGGGTPEKRFAVLPGRPPMEDLRRLLLESRDWYGPERYQRVLEGAGVTRSLMSVLAIEQGRTNALFELRPRELYRRVLEMLGDHAVLERYTEARRRFGESEMEVVRQTSAVQALELDLRQVERLVARLDDWEHQHARVAELEARLPAAELQIHLRRRAEASAKLPELRTKVRRGDAELAALDSEAASAAEREAQADTALEAARLGELAARSAWEAAHGRHVRAADRRAGLEDRARQAAELPPGDLDRLTAAAEAAARTLFAAETATAGAVEAETEARSRRDRLRAGLPVHPETVTRTLADLEAKGIESTFAAAFVDVADPAYGEAAEAALGDARWALLVSGDAAPATLETARRHRFPGPVYAGERISEPEPAGALLLAAGAPVWLRHWPETVALRGDGSWQDERGTWVAPPRERVLGQAGREAALTAAETTLEEAVRTRASVRAAAEAAALHRTAADTALATERRRRDLLREAEALPAAREEAEAAAGELATADSARDAAADAREDAHRAQQEALRLRLAAAVRVEQQAARLRGEREALERTEADLTIAEDRARELADRVSADLYLRAEAGELDGPDTVAADLDRARQSLAGLGDPPPREVREEALHLRANIEEAERHLAARRREAGDARKELTECRVRYLEIVSGALHDYRRRAADLAGGAEVTVEMELPRLVDDDRVLDEATIEVRFGFDGKAPLPLGDPSFSGGQQVIAGLILLMAMAETDGRGFFILDEPFAHLSLDRVDQVGRFLRAARAQFILTAPTTLDRAQLDPASLVIVLQKKRPGEPHAPVPIVAEA